MKSQRSGLMSSSGVSSRQSSPRTSTVEPRASTSVTVTVAEIRQAATVDFKNQVVPIFTKLGCNGGGCHGKSSGQNGFRLSLLGFEPTEDYEHLVREARGRRLFPAAPENSLLLTKATAAMPHGGGKRLEAGGDDYRLVVRWIRQGMPYGKPTDPAVAKIDVFPKERTLARGGAQQLVVLATYTDGSVRDVTRGAVFEPNDKNLGESDETGLVKVYDQPGDVAVMVRYQSRVAVFRATVPLGAPVENLPPARNFVDELVFEKLKKVGMPPSGVCDDATFLRRVTIDLAGRLPTPEEATAFAADGAGDKRDRLIDRLLEGTDHADFFANKWSAILRNQRDDARDQRGTYAFHGWIRDSFLTNKPYDRFVREILAASGDLSENPAVAWYREVKDPGKQLEDASQLFLGLRLQCAQCHHHPYEKWSQQDYYSFSAFFSRVGRKPGTNPGEETIFHRRGSTDSLTGVLHQMVQRLQGGEGVGVFPEGGTTAGDTVRTFHARIFQAAVAADAPVQPVALRYGEGGNAQTIIAFGPNENFMQNFLRVLGEPARQAEVHFLEPMQPGPDGRRRLAEACRERIQAAMLS